MKNKIKIVLLASMLFFSGCDTGSNKIDTEFLQPTVEVIVEVPIEPTIEQCEIMVSGNLANIWMDRIDLSNVKLNHYVNGVQIEDNLADIVDINGTLGTSNPITIPAYIGTPMTHVLVVEFMQTK